MGLDSKEFKEKSTGVDEVLKRHKNRINNENFNKYKVLLFILSVFLGMSIILFTYFNLPISYVNSIKVEGNDYLSDEYIINISGINYNSRYYLIPWFLVESKINASPFISESKFIFENNNIVKIVVEENNPVAYRYKEEAEILLGDGQIVPFDNSLTNLISRIPLVEGFQEENQEYLLIKSLSKLEKEILENISEIKQYEINYDDEMLMIYLRDGNYFFSSYYSIDVINSYNLIASQLIGNDHCIFSDESLKVAYRKVCPWNDVKQEFEYWTDENGEFILNKYGDKIFVHYAKDEQGNYIKDEQGNKIRIPIDKFGNEIPYVVENEQDSSVTE